MSKPKIILAVGILLAVAIVPIGYMLHERASERLEAIEQKCLALHGSPLKLSEVGRCDYNTLSSLGSWRAQEYSGIEEEILDAGRNRRTFHEDNVFGSAFFVFFLSALPAFFLEFIPWLWRFLLARIREVSDAIAGRSNP